MEVEGRSDITIDLSTNGALESLKTKPFTIKEGAHFRMKATFKVQHDVLSGLKYLQVVKRKGLRVGKDEEMIVSLEVLLPDECVENCITHSPCVGFVSAKYRGEANLREKVLV